MNFYWAHVIESMDFGARRLKILKNEKEMNINAKFWDAINGPNKSLLVKLIFLRNAFNYKFFFTKSDS